MKRLSTVLKNVEEYAHEKLSKSKWIPGVDTVSYSKPDFGPDEYVAAINILIGDNKPNVETEIFEEVCANILGKKYGVLVNSGSCALSLMTRLLKPDVLNTQDSMIAISVSGPVDLFSAVSLNRLNPFPIDIDYETLLPNINSIPMFMEKNNIRAIGLQHILGNSLDISSAENINRPIIEDCSHALGATFYGQPVGSFGMAAACSFDNTSIVSMINGGFIAVNNISYYDKLKSYRNNGLSSRNIPRFNKNNPRLPYDMVDLKFEIDNVALDYNALELQAAIGNVQLTKLEENIAKRKSNYIRLYDIFKKYEQFFNFHVITNGCESTYHAFPISIDDENKLFSLYDIRQFFEDAKIETRPFFANNIPFNPGYSHITLTLAQAHQAFPISFKVMRSTFLMPTNQTVTTEQLNYIEEKLDEFIKSKLSAKSSKRVYNHQTSV